MPKAKKYRFAGTIEAGRGGGAWVAIPFDVREEFGSGRVKVRARFDGVSYRGSIAPMGAGVYVIGIRKAIRAVIAKDIGDQVTVELEHDKDERTVELPTELQRAFRGHPEAKKRYQNLSYTRRRELAEWVAEAKKQETRDRRAMQALQRLEGASR